MKIKWALKVLIVWKIHRTLSKKFIFEELGPAERSQREHHLKVDGNTLTLLKLRAQIMKG